MRVDATFTVSDWTPAPGPDRVGDVPMPRAAAGVGLAHMVKTFEGDLTGRSVTWFLGCLNESTGEGTYAAVEVVDASVHGRRGTFCFAHAASTHGSDRYDEYLTVVPGSGTGELAGITGSGSIAIEADGTHHLVLDCTLPDVGTVATSA